MLKIGFYFIGIVLATFSIKERLEGSANADTTLTHAILFLIYAEVI